MVLTSLYWVWSLLSEITRLVFYYQTYTLKIQTVYIIFTSYNSYCKKVFTTLRPVSYLLRIYGFLFFYYLIIKFSSDFLFAKVHTLIKVILQTKHCTVFDLKLVTKSISNISKILLLYIPKYIQRIFFFTSCCIIKNQIAWISAEFLNI